MLKLMRRRYTAGLYRKRVELINKLLPDACIGVDVITGHPGETNELFEESFKFIESLNVSYLHVFTYSERPGTHALKIKPVVPHHTRKKRTHKLRRLSAKKRFEFDTRYIGQVRPVLFESEDRDGWRQGWTDNYIRVKHPADSVTGNSIKPVKISNRLKNGTHLAEISRSVDIKENKLDKVIAELTA